MPCAGDPPRPLRFGDHGQRQLAKATCRARLSGAPQPFAPPIMVLGDGLSTGRDADRGDRPRTHASFPGRSCCAHTRLSLSSCRIHGTTRFQLALFWSTTPSLTRADRRSVSFGLGKPREGCRAVAAVAAEAGLDIVCRTRFGSASQVRHSTAGRPGDAGHDPSHQLPRMRGCCKRSPGSRTAAGRDRARACGRIVACVLCVPRRLGTAVAVRLRMPEDKRLVYVLKSANPKDHYYIGLTSDVRAGLAAHNAGRCPHTARYRPWHLHVTIELPDEQRAVDFERYLTSGSGRAFAKRHFG